MAKPDRYWVPAGANPYVLRRSSAHSRNTLLGAVVLALLTGLLVWWVVTVDLDPQGVLRTNEVDLFGAAYWFLAVLLAGGCVWLAVCGIRDRGEVLFAIDEDGIYLGHPPEQARWPGVVEIVTYDHLQSFGTPQGGRELLSHVVVIPPNPNPLDRPPRYMRNKVSVWGSHRTLPLGMSVDRRQVEVALQRHAPTVQLTDLGRC